MLIGIVGIPVAAGLLNSRGLPQYVVPAISIIVGMHMFGIALAFRQQSLMFVGGAMCVLALLTVLLLPETVVVGSPLRSIDRWPVCIGLGNGTLLLFGCAWGARQLYRATAYRSA